MLFDLWKTDSNLYALKQHWRKKVSPNYLQISHKCPTFEEHIYWEHKLMHLLKVLRVIDKNRSVSIPPMQHQEGPPGLNPVTKQKERKHKEDCKAPWGGAVWSGCRCRNSTGSWNSDRNYICWERETLPLHLPLPDKNTLGSI